MGLVTKVLEKIIGTKNERELKKLWPIVHKINALEPEIQKLSNEQLAAKTEEFKKRLQDGETLDNLLVESFAVVREVARRTLNMRHFDVQLLGGIVLHQGKIAEMKTGEGKTLVATLPIYLNALTGKGVHLVTVNDYLARRDALWMGPIYLFLGLTVGVIQHNASYLVEWEDRETFRTKLVSCTRREAYLADITYGQNNEFGFDYLRDNMAWDISECVQRGHYYAIVDEVDSILIDEARTPLIISGPSEEAPELYYTANRVVQGLKKDVHYEVDEESKTVMLTEEGIKELEKRLGIDNLYDPIHVDLLHKIEQALRAHVLFKRDVDYVVKDGEVIIVDEFTGRLMPGRRWSDGLHQAIEAKEGVKIKGENQTLATITFQNYFRLYEKLAGMTGTAETEAAEFMEIYGLDVVVIPTHKPMIRVDYPDLVFRTEKEKWEAVVKEIEELHKIGRPVLVGTTSIEKSEKLSAMLKKKRIPHHVLNAKYHEKEAEIVAQAGRLGAVTIATNMAGRGTDIMLGGNPEFLAKEELKKKYGTLEGIPSEEWERTLEKYKKQCEEERKKVVELGGLHIIGTERHESRRIDNQLRGRAGRQGDPGSTRFYLSLEDDLLRIFGGDKLKGLMNKLGMKEGEPIEHPWVTRAIENAQKKVEAHNFEIRKHLLEYDDVMNKQREVVYTQRRKILEGADLKEEILNIIRELIDDIIAKALVEKEIDHERVSKEFQRTFNVKLLPEELKGKKQEELAELLYQKALEVYEEKEKLAGRENIASLERMIFLYTLDSLWKEHLLNMDHLRDVIGLRGYGQRDPLNEYKRESFELFAEMIERLKRQIIETLYRIEVKVEGEEVEQKVKEKKKKRRYVEHRGEEEQPQVQTVRRKGRKIGRNEPCPCGSGKKYKHCCGRNV
ncbi:preprotein translocase subunit SecA [Thermosulfidibacter takaii ABI70S6]|uniref:Protein translocase subunit SecA n=1 Tax=Thermosulfidibacter takaii (strain DSM 17441 / JCM 13301 / NBRC 103674 / ABI70S6) TaxID=1298851 RepID=A0A0S3QRC1_THET7|nr:preprotein translocase subunit SecA [Thermosulfidibacter takaii]BAT70876.1 preprotein translocase subunit SecA [Thermosulfidibacter takaii ABI70S6]